MIRFTIDEPAEKRTHELENSKKKLIQNIVHKDKKYGRKVKHPGGQSRKR